MVILEAFKKQIINRHSNYNNLEALVFFRDFLFNIHLYCLLVFFVRPLCTTRAPPLTHIVAS